VSDDVQPASRALAEVAAETVRHLRWLSDAGIAEVPPPALPRGEASFPEPGPRRAAPDAPPNDTAPRDTAGWRPIAQPIPARPPATPAATPGARPPACSPDARPTPGVPPAKGAGSPDLRAIRDELGECARCKLGAGRTTLVFGVGNPAAELMFVGEGPGADEDREGEPFVGRAGQLLTRMIEAMGYRREEVYIANVVKCRPPNNRNPEPDEIEACEPFLRAQIAAVRPKVIVALGKFAAQTLLRDTTPITRLRGRWMSYEGVRLMPTFHPAYLLRSPEEKKKAWEDLQLVMRELGLAPRGRE
jgi:uracil-DNA glycosylase